MRFARILGRWLAAALVAVSTAVAARVADAQPPQRIVSLNLCLDPLLLALVDRSRIAALTTLSADPSLSTIAGDIAGIALLRGTAEEVLALDPDLILAGTWTTGLTVELLRRLGRRVVVIPLPNSIADIAATIRLIAATVGAEPRGAALIRDFDRRLARSIDQDPGPAAARPSALVYHVNGLVSGGGSLVDDALRHAGFRNAAADHRLGRGGRLELEAIVSAPPDLVVMAQATDAFRTAAADNVRHPALRAVLDRRASLVLPMPLWLCGTPAIADAIDRLVAARAAIGRRP